jgi:uncharacterized protein YggE
MFNMMKKNSTLAVLTTACWFLSAAANAQQPMQPPMPMMGRTITVLASGSAGAVAERVTLGLTVSSGDQTATGLFVKQNDVLKHLEDALVNAGVDAKDIMEQQFHLLPNMEYGQNGTRIIGYRLDTPLEVQLDDVKDLPRIIDLATQSGASAVNVDGFGLAPGRSLHTEAINNAIENARKEAASIAKEMGKTVGDIISISEAGDETAAPAPAKGGEEEEERERGGKSKSKDAKQQPNTLSENAQLKVVFEVR